MTTTTTDVFVGDIGKQFILVVYDSGSVVNLSTASVKQIIVKGADGLVYTKTASFITDGSDGKIYWTTAAATDLNVAGTWFMQAKITMGGATWHTTPEPVIVKATLD